MENVPKWGASADASPTSPNPSGSGSGSGDATPTNDIPTLESTIHRHQSLYENMCQAYTEVHSNSKKLLYQLDHLVQVNNQTKEDAKQHVSSRLTVSLILLISPPLIIDHFSLHVLKVFPPLCKRPSTRV